MAVLIVLAIVLLAYGFYQRITSPDFKLFKGGAKPAATADAPAFGAFGDIDLGLPAGCVIEGIEASERWLFVRIGPDGACARVVVFDAAAGRIAGTLAPRR